MTWKGIDLSPIIAGVFSIVAALISWAAIKVKNAAQAASQQSNAQTAMLKLAAIATSMLGRAWTTLSPQLQLAIADGKITAEERAKLEELVHALVSDFTDKDDLEQMAKAIGLPIPGLIAKLASMLLDTFTKAHDPGTPEVSKLAYPVSPAYVGENTLGSG